MKLSNLFMASNAFERDEARADVYPMVLSWIENHKGSEEKIRGIATLLIVWNAGYYSRAGRGFSAAVEDLQKLFADRKFRRLSVRLRNNSLPRASLEMKGKTIIELYDSVDSHEGLGIAATSKILHLLEPAFFVMWDDAISRHYHRAHSRHQRGGGECYFEFLKKMQEEAKTLLAQMSQSEIERRLSRIAGYPKTIAKGLDEVNYMRLTVQSRK